MKPRKKILMIIPSLANGGAERVVSYLSTYMSSIYDITILLDYNHVTYSYKGDIQYLSEKSVEAKGIKKKFLYIKKLYLLILWKKKHMFDIYISHSLVSNVLNIMSGTKECKTIITIHNNIFRNRKKTIEKRIEDIVVGITYPRATSIVTVSKGEADAVKKYYNIIENKVYGIWNGSDIQEIIKKTKEELTLVEQEWFEKSSHIVTSMGRYVDEKGQWHLIRAFSKVVEKCKDAKLIIYGDGYLREYLQLIIEQLKLEEHVMLYGFKENPFSAIAKGSLFVFSSICEGFGYALEEAICCGTPCISTDFDYGAREIFEVEEKIQDNGSKRVKYGTLTPICSGVKYLKNEPLEAAEVRLAEEILYLLEHPEICNEIIQENSKRIEDFSIETMISKWEYVCQH